VFDKKMIAAKGWVNKLTGAMFKPSEDEGDQPIIPLLQSRTEGANATRIRLGIREFKIAALDVPTSTTSVPGGSRLPPVKMRVIVEKYSAKNLRGEEISVYRPLDPKTLQPITAVALNQGGAGEWHVRDGKQVTGREAWLEGDAFKGLDINDKVSSDRGHFHRVGRRDLCFADITGLSKDPTIAERLIVERVSGNDLYEPHYRLLNGDLSAGGEVGLSRSTETDAPDPFTAHARQEARNGLSSRLHTISDAAVTGAMRAGADVQTAIAVMREDLGLILRRQPGPDTEGVAIAAAAAAEVRRLGVDVAAAKTVARTVLALRDWAVPSDVNLTVPDRQHLRSLDTQADAALQNARTRHDAVDRTYSGPSVAAIDAAASALFGVSGETPVDLARARALAHAEALDLIKRVQNHALERWKAVNKLVKELEPLRRDVVWLKTKLGVVETTLVHAMDDDRLDELLTKSSHIKARLRDAYENLDREEQLLQAKQEEAREADKAARLVTPLDKSAIDAAVDALDRARKVAPDRLGAGMAAAHAAFFAATELVNGDAAAAYAGHAASTALLAALSGANRRDSEIAGMAGVQCMQLLPKDSVLAAAMVAARAAHPTAPEDRGIQAAAAAAAAAGAVRNDVRVMASVLKAVMSTSHIEYKTDQPATTFVAETDLDPRQQALEAMGKALISAQRAQQTTTPPGYEPVSAKVTGAQPMEGFEHARIRQVGPAMNGTTQHFIEIKVADGTRRWVEFTFDGTANKMTGKIMIKPSGQPDSAIGSYSSLHVGFNGRTKEWGPLVERERDKETVVNEINAQLDKRFSARDEDWAFWNMKLPYHADQNISSTSMLELLKNGIAIDVERFMRGQMSEQTFLAKMNDKEAELFKFVESNRQLKKGQTRRKLMFMFALASTVTTASLRGISAVG
jgi:hypothetical protein